MSSETGGKVTDGDSLNSWLKQDYDSSEYTYIFDEPTSKSRQSTAEDAARNPSPIKYKNPSGSRGKLGLSLEKLHDGIVLSQHEVAAALRDYNMLMSKLAELEEKTKHTKLVVPEEESVKIAPPGQGKITRDEKEALEEEIKRKDKLIADYQKRFQNLTHKTKTHALRNVQVEDVCPPGKIIDNFVELYEKEWYQSFETLKAAWHDDERAIFSLFRVVRHAYIFCFDLAEYQRTAMEDFSARMQEVMLTPTFTHPVSKLKYKPAVEISSETQRSLEVGKRLIVDYKNIMCSQAIPGIQELFRKVKLPELFETGFVNKAVRDFVNRTVELIWLMVIQEPPMMVYWLEPKQTVVKEYFKYYKERRPLVKQTVWPAVFRKEGGALLSKGVVLACGKEEFLA